MKKILSVITIMLMAFVLFACKGDKLTINFEANGGSEVTKMEISIDDLGKFVLPANPTKEGYEFKGWYLDPEFKDEFKSLTGIKNSITLYAKWEEVSNVKEFEVTYMKNPGIVPIAYLDGNYVSIDKLDGLDTTRLLGHHAVGVFWNVEEWTLNE
ncbi:MAG: hypothetical protein BHW12_06470 [Coprobacillus sp. 28_7]|nr:MAG: hypothetical protein BHW12_06470 [Coprobacillus sp. 28_7]